MKDVISIAEECIGELVDREVAKEKFFRKLIDELSKMQDKELVSYLEAAYFEKSSGKTKVILSYPVEDCKEDSKNKQLEFMLASDRLEAIISVKNKLTEKMHELGYPQTIDEIMGAYKEFEESFNRLIAAEAGYLASLK